MKQLTGNQVRQMFLDYFKSKGHMIEPGASLIPHNDPTLLWINAGVAALKKYFDGSEQPACHRIVNAQKSIRTNDIENVGKTARHHTFFDHLHQYRSSSLTCFQSNITTKSIRHNHINFT